MIQRLRPRSRARMKPPPRIDPAGSSGATTTITIKIKFRKGKIIRTGTETVMSIHFIPPKTHTIIVMKTVVNAFGLCKINVLYLID